jgi:hypothetical protein
MRIIRNFKNELSWDGVIAITAIIGIISGATMFAVETRATALEAKSEADKAAVALVIAAQKLADQQVKSDEKLSSQQAKDESSYERHFARLDSAIEMIATIMSERTGKPVTFPDLNDNSYPSGPGQSHAAASPESNDPP